jgi:FkbM family methyltransferase
MDPARYALMRLIGTQRWIRWGLRYRLFARIKPADHEFAVPFYGRIYRGNLDNFIDRSVYFWGAHEREALEYMGSLITPESVVLDVGANIGHHALYFSTKAKEVHAFEPNPAFRPRFEALMRENEVTNVSLHQVGLGNKAVDAPYYAPTGDNQGVGSFVASHKEDNQLIGSLRVRTGDEMVQELGLSRVDFIKIDVERYEEAVLQGLQETLRRYKPLMVMEYSKRDFSSPEALAALTPGYDAYALTANSPVLGIFNDPRCRRVPFAAGAGKCEALLVPRTR